MLAEAVEGPLDRWWGAGVSERWEGGMPGV